MRRGALDESFGQKAAQQRAVHLHHVGQIELKDVSDDLFDRRMVAAKVHGAVAAQKIEIVVALLVPEIGALGPLVNLVKADGPQDLHQGLVHVEVVERIVLPEPLFNDVLDLKSHKGRNLSLSTSLARGIGSHFDGFGSSGFKSSSSFFGSDV